MMRRSISLLLMLIALPALAEEIVTPAAPFTGWSWYNEPKKAPTPPPVQPPPQKPRVPDLSKMTAQEQAKVLRQYTMEALNRAILYPTRENTATYLKWQKFWTDRSSMFS